DIVIPKRKDVAGTSGSLPKATKEGVLAELMEVSKALEIEEEGGDEEGNPEAEGN
ncbi:hypothetical protein A2U01_0072093, partial [Trifolium medium]|nr:hypothetical protein [Trifolium medium]